LFKEEQMSIRTHRDLEVWKESLFLAERIYRLTMEFPLDERFGLTAQLRRSAVSIVSNIAEGAARGSTREFCRFVSIARGSLAEVDAQIVLSERLGFFADGSEVTDLIGTVGRLLSGLHRSLRAELKRPDGSRHS
jgi:four helix bundle protein